MTSRTQLRTFGPVSALRVSVLFATALSVGCGGGGADATDSGLEITTDGATEAGTDSDTDTGTAWDFPTDSDEQFNVLTVLSPVIGTVGIVLWAIEPGVLSGEIKSAQIEFGLDTKYGMVAPVDLNEPNYRTLLLGMKPSRTYHFRIVVDDDSATAISLDNTVTTGAVTNFLPAPTVAIPIPGETAGGFIVTSTFNMLLSDAPFVFIIDADGDLVWWYESTLSNTTRARMTYDGKQIAAIPANLSGIDGAIEIISMDGLAGQSFRITGATHDLTPTPDGKIAYLSFEGQLGIEEGQECAKIVEWTPTGGQKVVYDTSAIWHDNCHGNALRYSGSQDMYTVSDLYHSQIVGVSRAGAYRWVLNASGAYWQEQHGHQLLDNSILVYSNGENTTFEFAIDEAPAFTEIWRYRCEFGTGTLGDVQRLSGGNTLVTYSNNGVIHEVNPNGALVRSISFPQVAIGFSEWRTTLYGPPEDMQQ